MGLNADAVRIVREAVAGWSQDAGADALYNLLRMLGRWRSIQLAEAYVRHQGAKVWSGPFAGMEYVSEATEGALIPRLLGTYESELHPYLDYLAKAGLDCVVDVGCAEGYYAVGLARLMPGVTVHAFDTDENARTTCRALAEKNGVADRVIVGGEFKPEGFEAFADRRVLVMVDTEGAELDILQPELSPALAGMNVIVETHDIYRPGARATLRERFASTHEIAQVLQQPKAFSPPSWFANLSHLDQLLAVWEWRVRPTPWLVMRPKAG
jgi:SAM-dependent methyltransferase